MYAELLGYGQSPTPTSSRSIRRVAASTRAAARLCGLRMAMPASRRWAASSARTAMLSASRSRRASARPRTRHRRRHRGRGDRQLTIHSNAYRYEINYEFPIPNVNTNYTQNKVTDGQGISLYSASEYTQANMSLRSRPIPSRQLHVQKGIVINANLYATQNVIEHREGRDRHRDRRRPTDRHHQHLGMTNQQESVSELPVPKPRPLLCGAAAQQKLSMATRQALPGSKTASRSNESVTSSMAAVGSWLLVLTAGLRI